MFDLLACWNVRSAVWTFVGQHWFVFKTSWALCHCIVPFISTSFGDPGRIRTLDLVIRSHLLYPAELRNQQKKLVAAPGFEPGRPKATDFKSGVSTVPPCGRDIIYAPSSISYSHSNDSTRSSRASIITVSV